MEVEHEWKLVEEVANYKEQEPFTLDPYLKLDVTKIHWWKEKFNPKYNTFTSEGKLYWVNKSGISLL